MQRINPVKQLQQSQQTLQNSNQNNQNSSNTKPSGAIDTTNWKTYTNDRYKISFMYPSNWVNGNVSDQVNGPANFQVIDQSSRGSLNVNISNGVTDRRILWVV